MKMTTINFLTISLVFTMETISKFSIIYGIIAVSYVIFIIYQIIKGEREPKEPKKVSDNQSDIALRLTRIDTNIHEKAHQYRLDKMNSNVTRVINDSK